MESRAVQAARTDVPQYVDAQPTLFSTPQPDLAELAIALRKRAERKNTTGAYRVAWKRFVEEFCKDRGYRPLPASAQTLIEYLVYLREEKRFAVRTIRQHKAAIRYEHRRAGHVDPGKDSNVLLTWTGILIAADEEAPAVSLALWRRSVEAVVDNIDQMLKDLGRFAHPAQKLPLVRDKALILVLTSSARLTTGEVYSLRVEDLVEGVDGYDVLVKRSPDALVKARPATIKRGLGRYCPVNALREWLQISEIRQAENGAVFRAVDHEGRIGSGPIAPQNLRGIVKRRCALAGIAPEAISMRALRNGTMLQGGYDGEPVAEMVEAAGLGSDSRPRVAKLAAIGASRRRRGEEPPLGLELISEHLDRTSGAE
jgi:site-specific recombinase XerD